MRPSTNEKIAPEKQKPVHGLLLQQALLLLVSCLLIAGFFQLPGNKAWFNDRVVAYWTDFTKQKNNLDPEQRKRERWGNDYLFSKQIAQSFARKKSGEKALVLLPPTDYFKERNIDYNVPEPAVFYYYTGLKTVWINSKDALRAGWMVRAVEGSLLIDSVRSRKDLADSIRAFTKYKLPL